MKRNISLCAVMVFTCVLFCGCAGERPARDTIGEMIKRMCRTRYQCHVTCRAEGNTLWVYLPYTNGRQGQAGTKAEPKDLFVEYSIASFNPYRIKDPPELKFLSQRVINGIRGLFLQCRDPFRFLVLVLSSVDAPDSSYDEWYMAYGQDMALHKVGVDFSGPGYERLVWHLHKLAHKEGEDRSPAFSDTEGKHLDYHDVTMSEFVEKQIKWRVYKRFTLEYNKYPFDITAQEKREQVISIIKAVLDAYSFRDFEHVFIRDSSFMDTEKVFQEVRPEEFRESGKAQLRKPAF